MRLLLLFLLPFGLFAQTTTLPSPDNRIVVLGEAFVELPADRVVLTVTLTARDSVSVQRVYEKHKRLETDVVRFLREAALPDSAVRYQLLNVRQESEFNNNRRVPFFVTSQQVVMTLTNVRQYSDFLVKLMAAGFTDVAAKFSASQADRFQSKLLENAVTVARQKAETLAKAAGRRVARISKVMDTEETDPILARQVPFLRANEEQLNEVVLVGYGRNLTDLPQTIRLSTQVKVVFLLQ